MNSCPDLGFDSIALRLVLGWDCEASFGGVSNRVFNDWNILKLRRTEHLPIHGSRFMVLFMVQKSGEPVEVGSLYHYLQGLIHPRWLFGISEPSTVSMLGKYSIHGLGFVLVGVIFYGVGSHAIHHHQGLPFGRIVLDLFSGISRQSHPTGGM